MRKSILLLTLAMSGCSIIENLQERQVKYLKGNIESSEIISPEEENNEQQNPTKKSLQELLNLKINNKDDRNLEQSKLLAESEASCSKFVAQTHFQRAVTNIGLGLYSNIASTAAAIVSGRAGQNLAGLSSIFGFASDSFNQEMYSGILMPALVREIMQSREEKLKKIRAQQGKSIGEYPYPIAIMDALQYHSLCSIPVALTSLINKTDVAQALDYSSQITSIDIEIQKQTSTLKDPSLQLEKQEKDALRQSILALTKRRELMTLVLPHTNSQESANVSESDASQKKSPN